MNQPATYSLPQSKIFPNDSSVRASVVSITDNRLESWAHSRPNIKTIDVDEFYKTVALSDFGINDQCRIAIQLRSSIIFREVLATFRGVDIWARTSRVQPLDEVVISEEYLDNPNVGVSFDAIQLARANYAVGMPQDQARLDLPVTSSTELRYCANFRTWVIVLKTLLGHGGVCGRIYAHVIWKAITEHILFNGSTNLGDYNYDTKDLAITSVSLTDKEVDTLPNTSVSLHGITISKFETTLGHSAHFVRHQHNQYRSNIWSKFAMDPKFHHTMNLYTPITIVTAMPEASYKAILSHRAEWLADSGLWSSFVESGTSHMTDEEFYNLLDDPNNYLGDNIERINGTDPNLPDPRILEYPALIDERIKVEGENYILKRWKTLAELGYFNDNPENKYRIQYLNMLENRYE